MIQYLPCSGTNTCVVINAIYTRASMLTRSRLTLIDIYLTVNASETWHTGTLIAVPYCRYSTSSVVLAWIVLTYMRTDLCLTMLACSIEKKRTV